MFYIAICDDEDYFCRKEKKIIEKYMMQRECKVKIELFSSGEELLQNKNSVLKYGIIFLDISMEKLNGMETTPYMYIPIKSPLYSKSIFPQHPYIFSWKYSVPFHYSNTPNISSLNLHILN